MSDENINVVSLFSGCGGLDIGIANSGSEVLSTNIEDSDFNFVWSNDAMEHACKTNADNFDKNYLDNLDEGHEEGTVFCGDIRDVNFEKDTSMDEKTVNLVLGGFPCQDFSILRGDDNRGGIEVQRGKLYLEFVRALASFQPSMFVAENVKGLVSANNGKAYDQIMNDFRNLGDQWVEISESYEEQVGQGIGVEDDEELQGYNILHSDVVDFSQLGVPQGRERLIIIGVRKDAVSELDNSVSELQSMLSDSLGSYEVFNQAPLSTIEAFNGLVLNDLKDEYRSVMEEYDDYVDRLDSDRAEDYRKNIWPEYEFNVWSDYKWLNDVENGLNEKEIVKSHENVLKELGYWNNNISDISYTDESNEKMRQQEHVSERLRHIPPGENHRMVKNTEHHVSGMMSNIYKRVHPLKYSPTVIASGGGGTWGYHYERERGKLTNRERARIQTFPEDFSFTGTNSEVRKQIGNAVPPLGAKRVGENIRPLLTQIIG